MSTDNKPEPQDALPPLPEPRFAAWADSPGNPIPVVTSGYTADQMHDYARLALSTPPIEGAQAAVVDAPPSSWDEYAMRESQRLWALPGMPKDRLTAVLHVALIDAMRFAAPHCAQAEVGDVPTFVHGVAARKWASLQADGFRMQSLKFARADGTTGEINPWGVVTWDAAASQAAMADIEAMRADLADEQRLNGMGAEREARLMAQVFEMRREVERLRAVVRDAAVEIADWGAYAGEYFQRKHNLAGTVKRFEDAGQERAEEREQQISLLGAEKEPCRFPSCQFVGCPAGGCALPGIDG